MTRITVFKSKERYQGFQCLGHAGFAEYQKDIVCASISVLVINTINSIESFTDDIPEVNTDEKSGLISCSFSQPITANTQLLIDSMLLGLTEIKKQYGRKFIDIKFEEV